MHAGLLTVKSPRRAKSRLAHELGDEARIKLARALLEDALALLAAAEFLRWWIVSDDDEVLGRARREGIQTVRDRGAGLNEAVSAALVEIIPAGASSLTVLATDVPLAIPEDLRDLLDTGATSDVVVVPSGTGGTNALHLAPPDAIPTRFGAHSFAAHLQEAEAAGLRGSILPLPRLALDLDTPADLDTFLASGPSGETARVLSALRRP